MEVSQNTRPTKGSRLTNWTIILLIDKREDLPANVMKCNPTDSIRICYKNIMLQFL